MIPKNGLIEVQLIMHAEDDQWDVIFTNDDAVGKSRKPTHTFRRGTADILKFR